MRRTLSAPLSAILAVAAAGVMAFQTKISSQSIVAARDPGVRGGAVGAGGPLAGLTGQETEYFTAGKLDFDEAEEPDEGMGPRMNLDSCSGCHSQPAIGGTSPAANPQFTFANQAGGLDKIPSFIKANGPVREARFIANRDGTPDGGVHALFTVTGRPGADGCTLKQPDFATELANRNVIFRIPTPVFGAGLIEMIPDSALLANFASTATVRSSFGVRGRPNFTVSGRTITGQTNRNGNDGTIARFGWKAQNKSLLIFSGEAYNVEMGITNELFPTEREEASSCQFASHPNSITDTASTTAVGAMSSIEKFSFFMRLLAPPAPSLDTPGGATSIASGKALFSSVGCASCHTPSFKTGKSKIPALANQTVTLFSDLMIHDMGVGLSDGVSQGSAGPREFRTAPLWGLGQRIFFLHDGRSSDLVSAIRAHQSTGSEANGVVTRFTGLSETQKQNLLNFLRSL
jgi:mono/diheme cytochrome c family protein